MFISKKDYHRLSDLKDYLGFVDMESYPFKILVDIVCNIELSQAKHNKYYKKGV